MNGRTHRLEKNSSEIAAPQSGEYSNPQIERHQTRGSNFQESEATYGLRFHRRESNARPGHELRWRVQVHEPTAHRGQEQTAETVSLACTNQAT